KTVKLQRHLFCRCVGRRGEPVDGGGSVHRRPRLAACLQLGIAVPHVFGCGLEFHFYEEANAHRRLRQAVDLIGGEEGHHTSSINDTVGSARLRPSKSMSISPSLASLIRQT